MRLQLATRRATLGAISLLLLGLSGCATPGGPRPQSTCGVPVFPYQGGWYGGDAAYSIPLSPARSLWLFGDSFVGAPGLETRTGSSFIHNSIAISECLATGRWEMEYFWTPAAAGAGPHAFLSPDHAERYWWLFDGFVHDGALYIGLLIVEPSEPRGPLNLPFRYAGMKLARIANYGDSPRDWKPETLPLWSDSTALPGSTMVVHGEHLYLFTFLDLEATRYPRMLARLQLADLELHARELPSRIEYLAQDDSWQPGIDVANAKTLMDDNASEMSVRFHPEVGRWIAVYGYPDIRPGFPEVPPSNEVFLRTAPRVEGPWSSPVSIYQIPELARGLGTERDPNTFCYAAKEHPQLAQEGEILLTYVCNLFTPKGGDPWAILRRMDLYRPRPVALPIRMAIPGALDPS